MIAPFINEQDEVPALSTERRLLFFHRSIGAAGANAYRKYLKDRVLHLVKSSKPKSRKTNGEVRGETSKGGLAHVILL
jgi:hypothetical protein